MNLRRWITALAVLAVFTALAGAQVITPVPISCSVTAATTPAIRSEGSTELVGDILITCTGGPAPITLGNPTDRATITVNFGVPVTSNQDATSTASGASEALLSIDEPNTVVSNPLAAGFGQNAPIYLCTAAQNTGTPLAVSTACPAYQGLSSNGTAGFYVMSLTSTPSSTPTTGAANVYQGVVGNSTNKASVNQVSFSNVPVMAPVQVGVTRVYRVMNVRVTPGSAASITATVTITAGNTTTLTGTTIGSATTLSLTNSSAIVANSTASLTTAVTPLSGLSLCQSAVLQPVTGSGVFAANTALVSFKEGIANAFKTRSLPLTNVAGDAMGGDIQTGDPGAITGSITVTQGTASVTYSSMNSESGFITPVGGITAGLANSGTRLKALFTSIPANATVYISTTNVVNFSTPQTLSTTAPGNGPGDAETVPYAQLISLTSGGETAPFVAMASTSTANSGPGVPVVQLTVKSGAAEAVWEVTNNNYSAPQTFQFAVYVTYNTLTPPAIGTTGAVQLAYAPTQGTSSPATTTWIPRFAPTSVAAASFLTIVPCQTTLLFPFVTTTKVSATQHWETGIAIDNTGADPWNSVPVPSTPNPNSYCTLTFYGQGASQGAGQMTPTQVQSPTIGPGQNWAFVASDPQFTGLAPNVNFAGYIFAVCNFQFAHGFAFVEDGSPSGNAMGYLALVVDNRSAVTRAATLTGEDLSQ
jgi:hypothetical protein